MNVNSAKTKLNKAGYSATDNPPFFVFDKDGMQIPREFSARDLIRFARNLTDSVSQPNLHKLVKKYSNKKDRPLTRDLLNKGEFDKIPPNKRSKQSDRWAWD